MRPTEIKLPKSTKILIVEDDIDQRVLLVSYIRTAINCTILEAEDGMEALKIILQDKQVPDLILLDLMMPFLSGVEFLTILRGRAEFEHIPVVVCTAVSETNEIKGKITKHIHSYLVKPINRAKLLEKVLDALRPIRLSVEYQS